MSLTVAQIDALIAALYSKYLAAASATSLDYSIDGQSVNRSSYLLNLRQQIEDLERMRNRKAPAIVNTTYKVRNW